MNRTNVRYNFCVISCTRNRQTGTTFDAKNVPKSTTFNVQKPCIFRNKCDILYIAILKITTPK